VGLPRLQRVSGWKAKFEWLWRNLRSSCIDSESVIGGDCSFFIGTVCCTLICTLIHISVLLFQDT